MSNEITVNVNITLNNLGLTDSFAPGTIQVTQTGQLIFKQVIVLSAGVDTSISALITGAGAPTTYGICYLYNLDTTNYVEWGSDNAGAVQIIGQLNPGKSATVPDIPAVFRLSPGKTLRAKAHTGTCSVMVCVYNN